MSSGGRQWHVLVVDDTQDILDLMRELPAREGYRVSTSLAVLDMDKAKGLAPDVIVQDLLFEHTQETGWTFFTLIRLDPDFARVSLVLCTAAVQTIKEPEMAQRLNRPGVRIVLKPFDIEELPTVLGEVLGAQALIDQAAAGETAGP